MTALALGDGKRLKKGVGELREREKKKKEERQVLKMIPGQKNKQRVLILGQKAHPLGVCSFLFFKFPFPRGRVALIHPGSLKSSQIFIRNYTNTFILGNQFQVDLFPISHK